MCCVVVAVWVSSVGMVAQPVGGLLPVSGDRAVGTVRGQLPGPDQRARTDQGDDEDHRRGDRTRTLGMGERGERLPRRRRARKWHAGEKMREPEDQRDPDERLELVDVAEEGAGTVEEDANRFGDRRPQAARVAHAHQDEADDEDGDPASSKRHAAHAQSGKSRCRESPGGEYRRGLRRQHGTRHALGRDERRPRAGPAQHLSERRPFRCHARGFDEVEERGRHARQDQQRHHPPRAREHQRARPRDAEAQAASGLDSGARCARARLDQRVGLPAD